MGNLKILANVGGLGEVVESCADFYTQLTQLRQEGARLITPRDEAFARLNTKGKENIGRFYGTRTSAGFEYVKEQLPIFRVESRLNDLKLAKAAVEANRALSFFSTESTKEYEESLEQAQKEQQQGKPPAKRSVIVLPSRDTFTITDKENWEVLETILKDQAKPYFELNGPIKVYQIAKGTIDSQEGTILNCLWFGYLDVGSGFSCNSRDLLRDGWTRGVREVSA